MTESENPMDIEEESNGNAMDAEFSIPSQASQAESRPSQSENNVIDVDKEAEKRQGKR